MRYSPGIQSTGGKEEVLRCNTQGAWGEGEVMCETYKAHTVAQQDVADAVEGVVAGELEEGGEALVPVHKLLRFPVEPDPQLLGCPGVPGVGCNKSSVSDVRT